VAQVTVVEQAHDLFTVTIVDGGTTTSHAVAIPAGFAESVGWAQAPPAELVRSSFTFLLAREPAGSILRRFSLAEITDYFPDYPDVIRAALAD
jgi:hypothetical protein